MKIVYTPKCLEYKREGHPESPERVKRAAKYLKRENYKFLEPKKCSKEDLSLVHSEELIEKVRERNFHDPDCPPYQNIYEYARLAAGGALKAANENAFSLMRPPGHHAGRNSVGGFCYFNNLAIAVEKLGKKTLILDIDGHHGNGTQEIFKGDEKVEYVSLHRAGYPGTGRRSKGNCHNHIFKRRPGDEKYLKALDNLLDFDREFEEIAVSAGFDAYKGDPLASLGLTNKCYRRIGEKISEFQAPVFCVLEGGYHRKLGENIQSLIKGLEK